MEFGDVLRALISERGITQKDLAAQLNIAPSTLGNYVRNQREPDYKTLVRLARYFEVSTDYLLNNNPKNYTEERYTREFEELYHIYSSLSKNNQTLLFDFGKMLLSKKFEDK